MHSISFVEFLSKRYNLSLIEKTSTSSNKEVFHKITFRIRRDKERMSDGHRLEEMRGEQNEIWILKQKGHQGGNDKISIKSV